jgi:hypothetical protein
MIVFGWVCAGRGNKNINGVGEIGVPEQARKDYRLHISPNCQIKIMTKREFKKKLDDTMLRRK